MMQQLELLPQTSRNLSSILTPGAVFVESARLLVLPDDHVGFSPGAPVSAHVPKTGRVCKFIGSL